MAQLPFDKPGALKINEARMNALKETNVIKTHNFVLDVGCGVGRLSEIMLDWDLNLTIKGLEAREDNLAEAKRRYPNVDFEQHDIEVPLPDNFGEYHVALMFGLFYHLLDPTTALRNISEVANIIALESIVTDASDPELRPQKEPNSPDQALTGLGCRPTPAFIVGTLKEAGYKYIYEVTNVDHEDFGWEAKNDGNFRRKTNLRKMYIGSKKVLRGLKNTKRVK